MRVCDMCDKRKPRRLVKVKDVQYGKSFQEYDLCEKCYNEIFKPVVLGRMKT